MDHKILKLTALLLLMGPVAAGATLMLDVDGTTGELLGASNVHNKYDAF